MTITRSKAPEDAQFRLGLRNAMRGAKGVTLVEMLVYMTILSIVSVGIFSLLLEVQKSNINTANRADQLAAADLSLRRVQVKLGDSDTVSAEDLVDTVNNRTYPNACLRLVRFEPYTRVGYRFDGRNQYLRTPDVSSNWFPIEQFAPRSISVWFRADKDQSGRQSIVSWGSKSQSHGRFGFDLVDGHLAVALRCGDVRVINSTDLRDGNWHHVAVTHDAPSNGAITSATMQIYIDGKHRPSGFQRVCGVNLPTVLSTQRSPLFIGRNPEDTTHGYRGLISDLRIWQRAISPEEVYSLFKREPGAGSNIASLELHLPLDEQPPAGLVNRGQWASGNNPAFFNFDNTSAAVKGSIVDDTLNHSFCFIDDDGDGLHELWESATARDLPNRVGGDAAQTRAREWQLRSDDIFVPDSTGFFTVVGQDPETVIANFAVGKGLPNTDDVSQKTESKALASTRVKKRLELCSINPTPTVTATECQFRRAYIAIEEFDPHHGGRIDFQYASKTDAGDTITFGGFANVPTSIIGTWYKKHGVLKLESPDPLESKIWNRIMSQALYRPFGQSSLSQKTFTFGLGKLPYFENGKLYQYEFVSVPPDENSFAAATSTASAPQESACGMRSYLATIQSRLEQDHLVKAMETGPAAGVRSGWIGARVNGASEISWVTDPVIQKNFTFWQGDGVDGQPYNAVTNIPVIPNARNLISHDHLPLEDGHRKQTLVQHADITKKVHFTNWAGGNDSINCSSVDGTHVTTRRPFCQPVELGDGYGVAVNGHQQRKGTWVTSPDSGRQCDENQNHSICGFYREYDTGGEASSNSLAEQVTVDMSRLREFCLGD